MLDMAVVQGHDLADTVGMLVHCQRGMHGIFAKDELGLDVSG